MSENEMLVGRALRGSDGRKWCGNWDGKGGSHLRGRDRLLEVQENKPETGLLPTKVLHSEELEKLIRRFVTNTRLETGAELRNNTKE